MPPFEEIINSVSLDDIKKDYDGITMETWGKARPDLDGRMMSADEQRFNLAFYARAAAEHVGFEGFSEENRARFKEAVVSLYDGIGKERACGDFMAEVAAKSAGFIEDRHFGLICGGGKCFFGGGEKEPCTAGKNIAFHKDLGDGFKVLGEEYGVNGNGEKYPIYKIGEMKGRGGEDILVVSIPNLSDKNDYESWKGFIECFDKAYLGDKEKWEKGRIILDVRGNGGGEDKPIDHVAKRLYGNMVNTYKRCVIKDTQASNAFLHRHGMYKEKNYAKDGLKKEDLIERQNFSGKEKVLFDETGVFYPFNKKEGYKGRIDVLIDKKTGSSAESAYTSFYHHPNVRYVGQNTAGMQQYTQGSFTLPCGYLMRTGVTKLTYFDKEGENIEVKGHKPDVYTNGEDAFLAAIRLGCDEGRVTGFREINEERRGKEVFKAYDPKEALDVRKAYYAKYVEAGLKKIEAENIKVKERLKAARSALNGEEKEAADKGERKAVPLAVALKMGGKDSLQ